jgi:hypothetical protein
MLMPFIILTGLITDIISLPLSAQTREDNCEMNHTGT